MARFNGLVNKQNGFLDKAIVEFRSILEDRYPGAGSSAGSILARTTKSLTSLDKLCSSEPKLEARRSEPIATVGSSCFRPSEQFKMTLKLDPENLAAHYNLALIYTQLGDQKLAERTPQNAQTFPARPQRGGSRRGHRQTKLIQRRITPLQAIVIYSLQRPGAPESGGTTNSHWRIIDRSSRIR